MKRYLVFGLLLVFFGSANAQKKELRTALKELDKGNYEKVSIALDAAEVMLSSMDDKQKSDFYLLKSRFQFKGGSAGKDDTKKSVQNFLKVNTTSNIKDKELHYVNMINHLSKQGNVYHNNKDFVSASSYVYMAYEISKDPYYLYVSASWSVEAKDYENSLKMYEKLKLLGYKGVEKQFFALNKSTNIEELFNNELMRDASVKAKTHINPTEKLTKSVYPEIIKNIALIYNIIGQTDKALEAFNDARNENPNDLNLILNEANLYYTIGNIEKFKSLLESAVNLDPENPELQFNLGIIAAEANDSENAKKYYERAIEINPKYLDAYINLAVLILEPETLLVNKMNELVSCTRSSCFDKYDKLLEEKKQLYLKAIPMIEKALEIDSSNPKVLKKYSEMLAALNRPEEAKKYKKLANSLNQ